ncbi:nitrate reductase molybdenum cofactor assembly chaperone [Amphiplicatus metriothermophilus]|uniref:Respiratory nitrate reductase chaperone NarJ n=1 Tax=Amphiplicatus metriothermophilus TaxID=1519374 RepID=A0A239PQ08_9PROT|nr:nitrate reductase molybdenum cofactor assembly chaperone [Amphiplicatus metriothermophilus]MBB5518468.1 nitrate reductase delta subunit [Amphiplicatus metriothermophilus]SNT72371.1 respiratory nitrate reductase chaperone NarJ [Amphiplicatus metriothermophilus]
MTNTFKALSALLAYPTAEIREAAEDIRAIIHDERLAPIWALNRLDRLIDELESLDLYELQERYVFLFDRTRSLSLHLFEHVHGESRDRGQAMVDLRALYERAGLEIAANELPDYIPLFLEFLSTRPIGEARALLAEPIAVIVALKERLMRRKSPYATVFIALEQIAENAPRPKDLEELRRAPDDDPRDLAALDEAWEEAAVTFGPSSEDGCPATREVLARMHRGEAMMQPSRRQEDAR